MLGKTAVKGTPYFRFLLFAVILFYYMWIAAQIPYTWDDWSWGSQIGLRWFFEASINSRYAGNAIEIIITRFPVLKTIIMGLTFTSIPIVSVELVKRFTDCEGSPKEREKYIYLFFLANALMLLIPRATWRQTFGWVAGFSNYVTVSLAMLVYLLVITEIEKSGRKYKTLSLALLFLFGITMQLFVENITVCIMALTAICCIRDFVKNRKIRPEYLSLFTGNLIGTVMMFSSPIYKVLLETGTAVDGYRNLEINKSAGVLSETARLIRFFLFYYPDQIWSSNVWMCCYVCVGLSFLCLNKEKSVLHMAGLLGDIGYLAYFLYLAFHGKIQFPSSWWTGVFSAAMSLLFFFFVLIQCLILFDRKEKDSRFLLFLWIAAPAIMLPLVVVATGGGRCCLPTQMLQMLFCLVLTVKSWDCCRSNAIRYTGFFFVILFLVVCIGMGKAYFDIGTVKRSWEHDIVLAQNGVVNRIQLKAYPHGEYLWNANPVYGSDIDDFLEFYKIPDDVELWFDAWGPKP